MDLIDDEFFERLRKVDWDYEGGDRGYKVLLGGEKFYIKKMKREGFEVRSSVEHFNGLEGWLRRILGIKDYYSYIYPVPTMRQNVCLEVCNIGGYISRYYWDVVREMDGDSLVLRTGCEFVRELYEEISGEKVE